MSLRLKYVLLGLRARRLAILLAVLTPAAAQSQMVTDVRVAFAVAAEEVGYLASPAVLDAPASYAGRDQDGVPHYARRWLFSAEERRLLREQFGIEQPRRLYLSDTLPTATLIYDTAWDRGDNYVVGSHRVGAASVRRPGESWEQLERRLAATSRRTYPRSAHKPDTSLSSLDPVVLPLVERMLSDARRAGFKVKVSETRRTAERQAYLMTLGGNFTHTATSRHAEGYAVDVTVDDGDIRHARTREHWVAFRRWIDTTQSGVFRIIGRPEQSWDWPHIEYVGRLPGFGSLEELLGAARWCDSLGVADCTAAWGARNAE
ncbi:MAG: hypothetical protein ACREL3_06030 [Gemmatimonadales bacterium]